MPRIGVLAIQGDFAAHMVTLREAGAEVCEVRKAAELRQVDGLVIPGGESTTLLKFILNPEPRLYRGFSGIPSGRKADLRHLRRIDPGRQGRHQSGAILLRLHRCGGGTQRLWSTKESFETVGEAYLEGRLSPSRWCSFAPPASRVWGRRCRSSGDLARRTSHGPPGGHSRGDVSPRVDR